MPPHRGGGQGPERLDRHKAQGMGSDVEVSGAGPRPGGETHRVTSRNNGAFRSSWASQRGPDARLSPAIRALLTERALAGAQVGES